MLQIRLNRCRPAEVLGLYGRPLFDHRGRSDIRELGLTRGRQTLQFSGDGRVVERADVPLGYRWGQKPETRLRVIGRLTATDFPGLALLQQKIGHLLLE